MNMKVACSSTISSYRVVDAAELDTIPWRDVLFGSGGCGRVAGKVGQACLMNASTSTQVTGTITNHHHLCLRPGQSCQAETWSQQWEAAVYASLVYIDLF
jgi:hypothetical protein